jgi:D-alanine-D-alanine ligase
VNGAEFSCGVIQTPDGESVALPPTEIIIDESVEVFDFNAKYKSKATRKRIPMDASLVHLKFIQGQVKKAFDDLGFGVCTRIDGFLSPEGMVILHDPNTIPGMSPSSLIFKQTAEIGLTVTDTLTYFIRQSIRERMTTGKNYHALRTLLSNLDREIKELLALQSNQTPIHIEVSGNSDESFEESFQKAKLEIIKIASSGNLAFEVFTPMEVEEGEVLLPLHISHLSKDSGKEMLETIHRGVHPLIAHTREAAKDITHFFTNL